MAHYNEPHEPQPPEGMTTKPAPDPAKSIPVPDASENITAPSRKSLPTWAWLTVLVVLAFFLWFLLRGTLTVVPV